MGGGDAAEGWVMRGEHLRKPEVIARRSETFRLRAEAIAIMRMNGWDVIQIARKLGLRPATVKAALGRAK